MTSFAIWDYPDTSSTGPYASPGRASLSKSSLRVAFKTATLFRILFPVEANKHGCGGETYLRRGVHEPRGLRPPKRQLRGRREVELVIACPEGCRRGSRICSTKIRHGFLANPNTYTLVPYHSAAADGASSPTLRLSDQVIAKGEIKSENLGY